MTFPFHAPGEAGRFRVAWDQIVPEIGSRVVSLEGGITASTTQSQGQQPLTKTVNIVETVANASDVVTLPDAEAGLICLVRNEGANTLQIFPASGAAINGGAADASTTLAANAGTYFVAFDDTDWYSF